VVEYPYAEKLARLQQPLCDVDIVGAGNENATGVVVSHDDRGCPFPKWIAEDLRLAVVSKIIRLFPFGAHYGYMK